MSAAIDYKKLYNTAKGIACAKGFAEHSEDIAQEVLIKAHELGFKPRIEWEVINVIRREYGDLRTSSGRSKQRGTRFAVRLDAEANDDSESLNHDFIGSEFIDPLPEPGIERFAGMFGGIEAAVFDLILLDEENQQTVGDIYGLTEGRICQIKKLVTLKIQRAMISPEEFPESMNFDLGDIEL